MPYCMGSIIWQLNDCWPVTSWSLVDYELKPKLAYYDVEKSFNPVILSVQENIDSYDIYIVNEQGQNELFELHVTLSDFYGNRVWEKKKIVQARFGSSTNVFSIDKTALVGIDLTSVYLFFRIITAQKVLVRPTIAETFFHFVKPNQLKLPPAQFKIIEEGNDVYLESKVYTPYLILPVETRFGQNYLGNLPPGKYRLYSIESELLKEMNVNKIKCLNTLLNN